MNKKVSKVIAGAAVLGMALSFGDVLPAVGDSVPSAAITASAEDDLQLVTLNADKGASYYSPYYYYSTYYSPYYLPYSYYGYYGYNYYNNYYYYNPYYYYSPISVVRNEVLTAKASVSGNTVTLNWNKVDKATEYTVCEIIDGQHYLVQTTTDTSAVIKGAATGKTHQYIVRYSIGNKMYSASNSNIVDVEVSNCPAIYSGFYAEGKISLKWTKVDDAKKYRVCIYKNGKLSKVCETKDTSVKFSKKLSKDSQFAVQAYVDGKWTDTFPTDLFTVIV